MAFYDRPTTNAMYNAAGGRVVRVDMIGNTANLAAIGTYFQQKVNPPANWDFWNAIRDSQMWSNTNALDGYRVVGFGTDFVLAGTSAGFDATTNTVTHQGDDGFGWWSGDTLTPTDGGNVNVSRHFGLVNDGYDNRGNLWLLTADRDDGRFRNDGGSNQRSLVWLR